MVIEKAILATGKWINGKWVRAAAEAVTETASKGHWVNGKWVKEATQVVEETAPKSKALINFATEHATSTVGTVTRPILRKVAHTRLPEGMLPEEMTARDIRLAIGARLTASRFSEKYPTRILSEDMNKLLKSKMNRISKGIRLEGAGGVEIEGDWIYRKPSYMTDMITKFHTIPKERVTMSLNAHPDIIDVLDRFITKGDVIVNGKVIKTITPPKAYYKLCPEPADFVNRADPVIMYFRECATKEQLEALKIITEPYKSVSLPDVILNSGGRIGGSNWLSHVKEHSPDDLYNLYMRAKALSPELAEGINNCGVKAFKVPDVIYKEFSHPMERFRWRTHEGLYSAIESFVNDFEKALGKTGFDRMM